MGLITFRICSSFWLSLSLYSVTSRSTGDWFKWSIFRDAAINSLWRPLLLPTGWTEWNCACQDSYESWTSTSFCHQSWTWSWYEHLKIWSMTVTSFLCITSWVFLAPGSWEIESDALWVHIFFDNLYISTRPWESQDQKTLTHWHSFPDQKKRTVSFHNPSPNKCSAAYNHVDPSSIQTLAAPPGDVQV